MVEKAVVQAKTKCQAPDASQWHVVPRHIDTLEPVAFLKITEAVPLLLPIRELRVHKIRNAASLAGSHRLGDERIGRCLVPVLDHRNDMHHCGLRSSLIACQLDEPD